MSQINPFAGSIVQTTQAQRTQSAERESQVRRQQVKSKDASGRQDQFDHTVESTDAVTGIHEQDHGNNPSRKKSQQPGQEEIAEGEPELSALDITA